MYTRSRSYVNDSMTTCWPPGHFSVEMGDTVNEAFVRPFRTANVFVELTLIVSCLLAACGVLLLFV